jgi:hypothetical protein
MIWHPTYTKYKHHHDHHLNDLGEKEEKVSTANMSSGITKEVH